jgi:AcrR family transcriptional regulator
MVSPGRPERRTEDPRALRSRRLLVAAYLALASTPRRPGLTISEIVAEAGLHRSSFYAHFASVEDLAAYAVGEHLSEIHEDNLRRHAARSMASADSNVRVVRDILHLAQAEGSPLRAALHQDRALAEQAFGAALVVRVVDYYRAVPAYSALPMRRQAVSSEYIGHALSALVSAWLLGELELPEDAFVAGLTALLPPWIMQPELVNR